MWKTFLANKGTAVTRNHRTDYYRPFVKGGVFMGMTLLWNIGWQKCEDGPSARGVQTGSDVFILFGIAGGSYVASTITQKVANGKNTG